MTYEIAQLHMGLPKLSTLAYCYIDTKIGNFVSDGWMDGWTPSWLKGLLWAVQKSILFHFLI